MRSVDEWKAHDAAVKWEREQRAAPPKASTGPGLLDYVFGGYVIILALFSLLLNVAFFLSPVLLLVWLFKG